MLVEGDAVSVSIESGEEQIFNYAETFVIPAAAGAYTLKNKGNHPIKLVKAFVK